MRGRITPNPSFIAFLDLESKIRPNHPLRRIKALSDAALKAMDGNLTTIYSPHGRASIPPEQLLKASLLQVLYGIRSKRQLVERIDDSMTFRWYLDMSIDEEMWAWTYKVSAQLGRFGHSVLSSHRMFGQDNRWKVP